MILVTLRRLGVVLGGVLAAFAVLPGLPESLVPAAVAAVLGGAGILLARGGSFPALTPRNEALLVIAAAIAAVVLACLIAPRHPTTVDGQVYRVTAQWFARGAAGSPPNPHPELFSHRFLLPHPDGRLFGVFPPGWPAVLALGRVLGIDFYVGPLLLAVLIPLAALLARTAFPSTPGIAALTAWLLALSPMNAALAGAFLSHTLAATLTVGALLLAARARTGRGSVALGLVLGALFVTRPLNAVLLAAPIAIVFWRTDRPRNGALLAGIITAACMSVWYFAYNHLVTGDAFQVGQDAWFRLTEWNPDCHRLGFGDDIGCVGEHALDHPGHHLGDAAGVTWTRFEALALAGLGPTLSWLLALVPFFRTAQESARVKRALGAHVALTVAGYALFYYHGNVFGPRLWAEALPAAIILAAGGALLAPWRSVAVAVLFAGLPLGHALMQADIESSTFLPSNSVASLLAAAPGTSKLVFVEVEGLTSRHASKGLGLGTAIGGPPLHESPLVFAHALRDEGPAWLAAALPDHTPYLLHLSPAPMGGGPGLTAGLRPWVPPARNAPVHVDAIARWPLFRPDCGFAAPADVEGRPGVHFHATRPCRFDLGRGPSAGTWRIRAVGAAVGTLRVTVGAWSGTLERAQHPVPFGQEGLVELPPSDRVWIDVEGDAWLDEVMFTPEPAGQSAREGLPRARRLGAPDH